MDETQEGKYKIPWKRILKRFAMALPLDQLTWLTVTFQPLTTSTHLVQSEPDLAKERERSRP